MLPINFKPDSYTFSEALCITPERANELYLEWSIIQADEFAKLTSDHENESFNAARFTQKMIATCKTPEECCLAFFFIGKTCEIIINNPQNEISFKTK